MINDDNDDYMLTMVVMNRNHPTMSANVIILY